MKRLIFYFFLLGGMIGGLQGQILFSETFDYTNGQIPTGWSIESLFENDPDPDDALWMSTPDGTGSMGSYWGNRSPITSPTASTGAVIFNSDFLDSGGLDSICGGPACAPHSGALISPNYNLSTHANVGLRFFQYLRTSSAVTRVGFSTDNGNTWTDIEINQSITHPPFGGESDTLSLVEMDISQWAANQAQVKIRFVFEGSYFFWIIDDFALRANPGVDLVLEEVEWPTSRYSCFLTEKEAVRVRVRNIGTVPMDSIPITLETPGVGLLEDTIFQSIAPNDSVIFTFPDSINLSPIAGGRSVRIDIPLQGTDVQYFNNLSTLELEDCPLAKDTLGGEFIANELIVQFVQGTPQNIKDSLRNKYSAVLKEICGCEDLELWQYTLPINLGGGVIILNPEEVVTRVEDETEVNDTGHNYRMNRSVASAASIPPMWNNKPGEDTCGVTIGLIDTGLDFAHNDLTDINWENEGELPNPYSPDDDSNCFPYDHWGNHFIESGDVPQDDHSHGTHIAGLIYNDLPTGNRPSIMPLKVQAENGMGTMFHTVCAMYYAAFEGANILNMSLGYSGVKSNIMDAAFDRIGQQYNILSVTSTGNKGYWLDTLPHWPSDFSLEYPQVISVAAADNDGNPASFSNFSNTKVDIAAPGVDLYAPTPGNQFDYKSGTSMSAGIVTRAAAIYLCCHPEATGEELKEALLYFASTKTELNNTVIGGKFLNSSDSTHCFETVSLENESLPYPIEVYPNPFHQQVSLELRPDQPTQIQWQIMDLNGRVMQTDSPTLRPGLNRITLETTDWAKGIYVVYVHSEQGFFVQKLIKY